MQEKYGFVYIWYDRKHKRFYIGCHWGNVDDGYICSSSNMKSAYRRRPLDFKRKILETNISNKVRLLEKEYKWLSLIKKEELNKRYYNLHNYHFSHWSTDEDRKLTIGEKISNATKGRIAPNKGKKSSIETREKIKQNAIKQFASEESRNALKNMVKKLWEDPEYRQNQLEKKKGRKQSSEQIEKRNESIKKTRESGNFKKTSFIPTDEYRLKMKNITANLIWINNGIINRRIPNTMDIPNAFIKGRIKISNNID